MRIRANTDSTIRAGWPWLPSRDVLVAVALTLAAAAFIGLTLGSSASRAPERIGPSAEVNPK